MGCKPRWKEDAGGDKIIAILDKPKGVKNLMLPGLFRKDARKP
jgi:hypothetical protein